ncbi:hypothetical protein BDR22DRAFT_825710 [Usnea florida]
MTGAEASTNVDTVTADPAVSIAPPEYVPFLAVPTQSLTTPGPHNCVDSNSAITNEFKSLGDVAFVPLIGKIYRHYDPKWVFIAIFLLFEIASVVCAAAKNSVAFILGRAIAGLGNGGSFTGDDASIPLRIITQRTVALATIYATLIGGSVTSMIYYIPLWFQAIQGVSAVESGIRTIFMMLAMILSALLAGFFVRKQGYYVPPMILAGTLAPIGAGLISTFWLDTSEGKWIGISRPQRWL